MAMKKVTIVLEGEYIVVYSPEGEEIQVYPLQKLLAKPGVLEEWLFLVLTGHRMNAVRRRIAKEFLKELEKGDT